MYNILVIEDDASYRNSIKMILTMEGFGVSIAADGGAGLGLLRESRPDLILCDIMMPGMDGHTLLETVKNNADRADIPFIFVTAMGDRADIRRGMASGADDYLSKPFSAEELISAVTGRIRRHEMILQQRGKALFPEEQALLRKITRREREVLLKVGKGATSREIAEQLEISLNTVEAHRANLMSKLDAVNAASLARWAFIAEQLPDDAD